MYRFEVAVPEDAVDELTNVIGDLGTVEVTGEERAGDRFASDPDWYGEPGDIVCFVTVTSPTLTVGKSIKDWLDQRKHGPMIDVRGKTGDGNYDFSFRRNGQDLIDLWITETSERQPAA